MYKKVAITHSGKVLHVEVHLDEKIIIPVIIILTY